PPERGGDTYSPVPTARHAPGGAGLATAVALPLSSSGGGRPRGAPNPPAPPPPPPPGGVSAPAPPGPPPPGAPAAPPRCSGRGPRAARILAGVAEGGARAWILLLLGVIVVVGAGLGIAALVRALLAEPPGPGS